MTRQHYEHLATLLGAAMAQEYERGDAAAAAAERMVDEVARGLASTNPRYDRGRFIAAVYKDARRYGAAIDEAPARA
jgi:hypothetical protein